MTKPLGVALLGCGTVGGGVAELLLNHALDHLPRMRPLSRDSKGDRDGIEAVSHWKFLGE